MHGVMYWSSKCPESVCSQLITWQDRRCSAGFLSSLPPSSPYPLSTGYGCATTAWLARKGPEGFLYPFDRAGNVMDFVGEEEYRVTHFLLDMGWGRLTWIMMLQYDYEATIE